MEKQLSSSDLDYYPHSIVGTKGVEDGMSRTPTGSLPAVLGFLGQTALSIFEGG